MAAIDLYSGMGGWTLGFKMAGIPVISSYEWWKDANNTHNKNFGSTHKEVDIRGLALNDLPDKKKVDFVIGSPPCTQFSLANRGGKGDITDGLIDIQKFLEVVEYLEPKYWAMENVPRVANIIKKELEQGGQLNRFKHLFGDIRVYKASDFGVPQDRKRMIAGRFPFELLDSYAKRTTKLSLGDVLNTLDKNPVKDPIYGLELDKDAVTDHIFEPNLSLEEERINRDSKLYHPVYNVMSFPDRQDRPSRTITALCTRVSRESIVIRDSRGNLRRLTVRERGCIQSFPINFQFFSKTYAGKIKMIGNAVPPLLTFYIAQSMKETPVDKLLLPQDVKDRLVLGSEKGVSHQPDNEGAKYSWNRSFWLAIKGLRFGSGVRFELKNRNDKDTKTTTWRISFYYGNSKSIKQKVLDNDLLKRLIEATDLEENDATLHMLNEFKVFVKGINEVSLQENWTNKDRKKMGPIQLIDELSRYVKLFKDHFNGDGKSHRMYIESFIKEEFKNGTAKLENKKLQGNSLDIFIGMCIGACFNIILEGMEINFEIRESVLA